MSYYTNSAPPALSVGVDQSILNDRLIPPTPSQRHDARLYVAEHATDAADLAMLLENARDRVMSATCNRPQWGDADSPLHCHLPAGHDGGHVCRSGRGSEVESLRHEDDGGS